VSDEPIWFLVTRAPWGESASVVVGLLPATLRRKIPKDSRGQPCEPNPLIYSLRLDKLPSGQRSQWIDENGVPVMPIAEMYRRYCRFRDRGKLPRT
jgi:hypothetical protein